MGFLDKAKKMAEQAQSKLDDVQQQFSEKSGAGEQQAGPAVEYDQHGRPIQAEPQQAPPPEPHGDPLAGAPEQPAEAAPQAPEPDPAAPQPPQQAAPPPAPDPGAQPAAEDPNRPSYEPPKLSGGDPLAG